MISYLPDPLPEPLNRQLPPVYSPSRRLFGKLFRRKEARTMRVLEEDYVLELPGRLGKVAIPKGIEWDFASVPRALWDRGFAPFELSPLATLWHDMLCKHEGRIPQEWWVEGEPKSFNHLEAADQFLALMERQGVNGRRVTAWRAVKRFGPKFGPTEPSSEAQTTNLLPNHVPA